MFGWEFDIEKFYKINWMIEKEENGHNWFWS